MNKAFDANKVLKSNIDSLMNTVANPICTPMMSAYTLIVTQLNAFVGPVDYFKKQIISNVDNMTTSAFNEISSTLNMLSSNIPNINLKIKASTLQDLNIFKKTCLDFNDILPNAMKNLITDGINEINDFASSSTGTISELFDDVGDFIGDTTDSILDELPDFEIPEEIQDGFNDCIDFFKDNALTSSLSDVALLALSPLKMYRDFIKSTGIIDLLKRLQKFEKCLTNKENCNMPKKNFYYPGTKKYNSQYYMDLFAINLKGEIQLKKITGQVKGIETKVSKTMNQLNVFNSQIIK